MPLWTRILFPIAVLVFLAWVDRLTLRVGRAPSTEVSAPRAAVWHSQSVRLSGTGFIACAGPWRDSNPPDRYTISVEKPYPGGSKTYFEKELRLAELPDGFVEKSIHEIVEYDPASETVSFQVGPHRFEYRLPRP